MIHFHLMCALFPPAIHVEMMQAPPLGFSPPRTQQMSPAVMSTQVSCITAVKQVVSHNFE